MLRPLPLTAIFQPRDWILTVLTTLVFLMGFWFRAAPSTLIDFDDRFYLGVAYDIRHEGIFSDGFVFSEPGPGSNRPPGMFFAPLYPAFLAVIGSLDGKFARAMDCTVETRASHEAHCPTDAALLNAVQFCLLVSTYVLIVYLATVIFASRRIAWLTLVFLLAAGNYLMRAVPYAMTEVMTLFFVTASMAAAVTATSSGAQRRWWAAAGIALAMAALTRPNFLYLFLACCLAGAAMTFRARGQSFGMFLAFAIGGA
jgi:hypothetical protein